MPEFIRLLNLFDADAKLFRNAVKGVAVFNLVLCCQSV